MFYNLNLKIITYESIFLSPRKFKDENGEEVLVNDTYFLENLDIKELKKTRD
ncbi:hypothetical protein [Helicobacter burdigaliensis]|uniref:hypothetical protein n=1 Tax=Helicobacter burdigaliensis TaxID=2315334 RepID=UPI001300B12B|nr:hypothetical protein [Helicobacter burdigaliensis]